MEKQTIVIMAIVLLAGVGVAVGGSAIYSYIFDMEFTNIESANMEMGSLVKSDEAVMFSSQDNNLFSHFAGLNKTGLIKYSVEEGENNNKVFKYPLGSTLVTFTNPTCADVEALNPNVNCGSAINLRLGLSNLVPVVMCEMAINGKTGTHLRADLDYSLINATSTSHTSSAVYYPQSNFNSVSVYFDSWTSYSYINQLVYNSITCGKIEYDGVEIFNSDLRDYVDDYDSKEIQFLFTNDEYNNLSDSMSLVVNKHTGWNTYEYYLEVSDKVYYMDGFNKYDETYLGDLNSEIQALINEEFGNSFEIYVKGEITNPTSVMIVNADKFAIIKGTESSDANIKVEYISESQFDATFIEGVDFESIFKKKYPVDTLKAVSLDYADSLIFQNVKKSTIVRTELLNEEFDGDVVYKLLSKDALEKIINYNSGNLNAFTNARFEDLLKLEDNSDFIYNNESHKFGNDTAVILTDAITLNNGSIVNIEDLYFSSDAGRLILNNNSMYIFGSDIKYSGIGTIYDGSNVDVTDSKRLSPTEFDASENILLSGQYTDFSSINKDEISTNVFVEQGILMFQIIPKTDLFGYSNDFGEDVLNYDNNQFKSFIYLQGLENAMIEIIGVDNEGVPFIIEALNLDISINSQGINIMTIE